jgi:hypothetical protein
LAFPWVGTRIPARIANHFPRPVDAAGAIDPANGDFVPAVNLDVSMHVPELLANSDALAVGTLKMFDTDLLAEPDLDSADDRPAVSGQLRLHVPEKPLAGPRCAGLHERDPGGRSRGRRAAGSDNRRNTASRPDQPGSPGG